MCAAFQLLHQINDVLQINVVIDWLFRVFLVEGDLMKIPIIEKLLHRPDFGRQSPTDRMVDAAEPLWRACLENVDVCYLVEIQAKAMYLVYSLEEMRADIDPIELQGFMANSVQIGRPTCRDKGCKSV